MWRWRFWTACLRRSSAADARRGRLAVLVGACLLAAAVPHAPAADKLSGVLSVKDSLTSPGKPVRLEARLVRAGLLAQGGLGGELVEFLVDGRSAGTAMTGGDGRAFLDYTPRMRGNQRITVRLATTKRVESPEARGTLFAWERRRPILLVELAVLAEERRPPPPPIPPVPFDIGPGTLPSPAPDAAHELKRLTDYFYNVIYLSWQPERGLREGEDVREWLDRHQFPPGLAITLPGGASALATGLDNLKAEGWDNLKAGIGRTREFAEVLTERRITVIVMPASDRVEQGLPRKARVIRQWKEVRQRLQG